MNCCIFSYTQHIGILVLILRNLCMFKIRFLQKEPQDINLFSLSVISETLPKLPLMYIEVSSIDAWERYRLEGYGYTPIPATPGKHTGKLV